MTKKPINILEINNLNVEFPIFGGIIQREISSVHAVKNLNLNVANGETIAIVGESGSGKSVTSLSINRLIPNPPGEIVDGKVLFKGTKLLDLSYDEMKQYRGKEIATIDKLFNNPLHPYTKALMQSIPKLDKKEKRLKTLKGMVPSILELGDGCKLCSRFDPKDCACGGTGIEPELFEHKDNHFVRCNPDIL